MKSKFILKKCLSCGATVEVIKDCKCKNCGIQCCGKPMVTIKENSVDCAVEKHVPTFKIVGSYIVATVNHVMEEEHYIEYIALDAKNLNAKKYFKPGDAIEAVFPYVKGSKLYAYCNKHGLWEADVK